MKRTLILLSAIFSLLTLSAQNLAPYRVSLPLTADDNGSKAVIVNFDTGEAVDSVIVADNEAVFTGSIDDPIVARVLVNGRRSPQFILESGGISFSNDGRKAFGSPLNDSFNEILDSLSVYENNFALATSDDEKRLAYQGFMDYTYNQMVKNADNPIGYILFMELAYEMEPKELIDFIDNNPSMARYSRVEKLVEANRKKAATSVGAKFIDFDIEGKKLSDYVGKDEKYLLVDFFASWCGPCVKQLPVLKELYSTYGDKMNVLGVAVWDEPEASLRAIEQHQLPWPCIINAGTVPTDIYGISGIPCIMLIGPDGTILLRDLQGDELKEAVANIINS